jgi:hypothetical protein
MYLAEQQVDAVELTFVGLPSSQQKRLQETIQQLLKRHKQKLQTSDQRPCFCLEGVPSRINHFSPLLNSHQPVSKP